MAHVIAMAGKGGVGKTTLCGLLIQYLCETGHKPVLAVDADANSNLNEVLGVEVESTLGEIREEIEKQGLELLGVVPHDDLVYQYDCDGRPTVTLPVDSPVRKALREIVVKLGL